MIQIKSLLVESKNVTKMTLQLLQVSADVILMNLITNVQQVPIAGLMKMPNVKLMQSQVEVIQQIFFI
jgi:predicted neuraminidase